MCVVCREISQLLTHTHMCAPCAVDFSQVRPPVGELLRPQPMPVAHFDSLRSQTLTGMHESAATVAHPPAPAAAAGSVNTSFEGSVEQRLIATAQQLMHAAVVSPPVTATSLGVARVGEASAGTTAPSASGSTVLLRLSAVGRADGKPVLVVLEQPAVVTADGGSADGGSAKAPLSNATPLPTAPTATRVVVHAEDAIVGSVLREELVRGLRAALASAE